ncbi:MAG TPA: calcium/sodium antiporter [Tepidisphaeraceae bacterium]|nr:calcium/sodium antiporter [Tepidisphaeraceae bacterium]
MISILLIVLGLALLVLGGEWLVRGASALALRLGVRPVVIGLTVVAFGTSAPELVVNLAAAWRGNSEIGFGNVVGSNIGNIGLLLGLTAVLWPLAVHSTIVVREIPMMVLAALATVALGADRWLGGGAPGGPMSDMFTRGEGCMLLLLFGVFLYYTFTEALRGRADDALAGETAEGTVSLPTGRSVLLILGGLACLVGGGQATVLGASRIAQAIGVPDVVIGLTIVAVGTSLPELVTSIVAARRGAVDVAFGNIVGSNIFNLLFIYGLTMTIAPAPLPPGGTIDLLVMTGFSAILLPMAITGGRSISRLEGGILLALYVAYMAHVVMR